MNFDFTRPHPLEIEVRQEKTQNPDLKRSLESSEVQDANIRVDLANKEELSSFLNDHLSQKEYEEDQTYSDELRDLKIPSVDRKNFDSKLAFLESAPEYSQRIQVVA